LSSPRASYNQTFVSLAGLTHLILRKKIAKCLI